MPPSKACTPALLDAKHGERPAASVATELSVASPTQDNVVVATIPAAGPDQKDDDASDDSDLERALAEMAKRSMKIDPDTSDSDLEA